MTLGGYQAGPHYPTGPNEFTTCYFMLRFFLITVEARTRLVTSRGQINSQVIISIKMVVQMVISNSAAV